jgi:capsular exopolysaccharide synthesis family protein
MSGESRNGRALARVHGRDLAPGPYDGRGLTTQTGGGGLEGDVRAFVNVLRRRARLIRVIFLSVVAMTLLVTYVQSPVYRASALLEIRRGDGDVPSIEGLFAEGDPSGEYMRTHIELLQSATLATRVIEKLGLDQLDEFGAGEDTPRQAMVERFRSRLTVHPVVESHLVRVIFEAGSPELAARVVNEIVSSYADLRIEGRGEAAQRLAAQVESVGEQLEETEAELRAYSEENGLPYLVEEDLTTDIGTRLRDLRGRLAQAEGIRQENQALYEVVRGEGQVDIVGDDALRELEAQLSGLRREYGRLSSTFTDDYPVTAEVLRQIEHVRELIAEERARVEGRVGSEYRLAMQRESLITESIERQEERANQLGPESGRHHLLRQAVLANRALYVELNERRREAETAVAIGPTDFTVVDPAAPPTAPFRPVFAMNMGLALMLGMVLGLVGAFAKELMDDTVQNVEDIPARTAVPILGMIPSHEAGDSRQVSSGWSTRKGPGAMPWSGGHRRPRIRGEAVGGNGQWLRIDTVKRGGTNSNAVVDAFGALRTAVLFRNDGSHPRSILISSCRAGEGKTTVSVNLAMSLAKLGSRVLLVDADLRRPSVHRALGLHAAPGLVNHLSQDSDWKALVRVGVVDGLDVLTSGGATTRAADLLAGGGMAALLREADARYDYVLVDAPALFINASDATLLSREVDGVVVVVRSRSTPRNLVDRISIDVPNVMGVVLNDLDRSTMPDYGDYFAEYGETNGTDSSASGRPTRSTQVDPHSARPSAEKERVS